MTNDHLTNTFFWENHGDNSVAFGCFWAANFWSSTLCYTISDPYETYWVPQKWCLHNLLMGLSLGNLGQHHWKYQCTKMQLATIGYNWLDCPCYSHSCSCLSLGKNLVSFDSLSCCCFFGQLHWFHRHTLTFCWNHRSCPMANCHHTTFPWQILTALRPPPTGIATSCRGSQACERLWAYVGALGFGIAMACMQLQKQISYAHTAHTLNHTCIYDSSRRVNAHVERERQECAMMH